jgi:hypothetical protein
MDLETRFREAECEPACLEPEPGLWQLVCDFLSACLLALSQD